MADCAPALAHSSARGGAWGAAAALQPAAAPRRLPTNDMRQAAVDMDASGGSPSDGSRRQDTLKNEAADGAASPGLPSVSPPPRVQSPRHSPGGNALGFTPPPLKPGGDPQPQQKTTPAQLAALHQAQVCVTVDSAGNSVDNPDVLPTARNLLMQAGFTWVAGL